MQTDWRTALHTTAEEALEKVTRGDPLAYTPAVEIKGLKVSGALRAQLQSLARDPRSWQCLKTPSSDQQLAVMACFDKGSLLPKAVCRGPKRGLSLPIAYLSGFAQI